MMSVVVVGGCVRYLHLDNFTFKYENKTNSNMAAYTTLHVDETKILQTPAIPP